MIGDFRTQRTEKSVVVSRQKKSPWTPKAISYFRIPFQLQCSFSLITITSFWHVLQKLHEPKQQQKSSVECRSNCGISSALIRDYMNSFCPAKSWLHPNILSSLDSAKWPNMPLNLYHHHTTCSTGFWRARFTYYQFDSHIQLTRWGSHLPGKCRQSKDCQAQSYIILASSVASERCQDKLLIELLGIVNSRSASEPKS